MQTQNTSGYQTELKQIGDKIESIAKKLKAEGKADKADELYELGDQVEHFYEGLEGEESDETEDSEGAVEKSFGGTSKAPSTSTSNSSTSKNQSGQVKDSWSHQANENTGYVSSAQREKKNS